jgi:CubicO group peptidase (beta-lactamase class C family)
MKPDRRLVLLILFLLGVLLAATACRRKPPEVSDADAVQGPLGTSLDRYLSALVPFGFSGSALVAKDGQIVLNKGYGLADRAHGRPYTARTVFDIASISKQFTATAILKLEEEGRLKVEDLLSKYLGPLPGQKAKITLHMLLTHTAGLPEFLGDEYEPVSRDELVRRALDTNLIAEPGTKFHYSNAGYSLLAAVVEIASKEPYEQYLRERVWEPAGLRHTGFHIPDRDRIAHGYTPDGDWGTPLDHPWAPDGPYWILRGNGGVLSTTSDLYRWHLALAGDTVLPQQEREKLITPYVSEGKGVQASYGYGWGIGKSPKGGREISHVGGNLVFDSDVRRYLDEGAVIIVSSNSADYSAILVAPHIESRIFGLPDPEPPAAAPVDPALLARRAGVYDFPSGDRLQVRVEAGNRLALTPQGPQAFTVLLGPLDDDERGFMALRETRTAAALDGLRAGNAHQFAKIRTVPYWKADQETTALLGPWKERLGAWQSTEILGNESHGGHPFTYARLTFEKGAKLLELGWSGMGVETLRITDTLPAILFIPQADGSFASYDVRTGGILRITFADPGGGAPAELVAPSGTAKATS